jgi:peptidyl-prolyl cis-trans isomerase C
MPCCSGAICRSLLYLALAGLFLEPGLVAAQSPAPAIQNGAPAVVPLSPPLTAADLTPDLMPKGRPDPVVASVDGHLIYLSDLGRAIPTLPLNLRDLSFDMLFPVLLDRMVDHEALVMMARRKGLEDTPAVQREIQAATGRVLEGAYLADAAYPKVTEAAILARFTKEYASRPAVEEVRARHILVGTEHEADDLIARLRAGADFGELAREYSKDPDAERGGDLGFFRREQVWPGFADVAFSVSPGQVAPTPIRNEFGWHVLKVEERRLMAPPGFSDVHDAIRDQLQREAVQEAIQDARKQVSIHRFNLDGSEITGAMRPALRAQAAKQASSPPAAKVPPPAR